MATTTVHRHMNHLGDPFCSHSTKELILVSRVLEFVPLPLVWKLLQASVVESLVLGFHVDDCIICYFLASVCLLPVSTSGMSFIWEGLLEHTDHSQRLKSPRSHIFIFIRFNKTFSPCRIMSDSLSCARCAVATAIQMNSVTLSHEILSYREVNCDNPCRRCLPLFFSDTWKIF